jgi:hypothetical protein
VQDHEIVVTIGRLDVGGEQTVQIPVEVSGHAGGRIFATAEVSSSTALPVGTNFAITNVNH